MIWEFLRRLFKRSDKKEEENREITICDRYRPICTEAAGYMWLRIIVATVVICASIYVAFQSKSALDSLKFPKSDGVAAFLASGFSAIAIPHCSSCIRCRSLRELIRIEWGRCCSREPSPTDEEVEKKIEDWQKKLSDAASVLPKSGEKKDDK